MGNSNNNNVKRVSPPMDDRNSSPEPEEISCCQLNVHQKKIIRERQEHHLDPTYNGPLKNRSCTDIICLLLFLVFLASWVALGIYAFSSGSPGEIFAPRDSENNKCGYADGLKDKPELLFFDLTSCILPSGGLFRCDTPQVCIKKCPEESFSFDYYMQNPDINASFVASKMICTRNAPNLQKKTKKELQDLVNNKTCASYYLQSVQVVHRCLPDLAKFVNAPGDMHVTVDDGAGGKTDTTLGGITFKAINETSIAIQVLNTVNEFSMEVVRDLNETWPWILVCVAGAMLVSFLYIMIMRWIAGLVIWFSLIASVILLGYASYISWTQYDAIRTEESTPTASMRSSDGIDAGQVIRDAIEKQLEEILRMKNTWLAFFIISVSLLTILSIIIIFLRSRIVLAISLINEGSRAVAHSWSTLFFPIFPWLLQLAVIFYGVAICMFLFSSGVSVYKVTELQNDTSCHCSHTYEDGSFCLPEDFAKYCSAGGGSPCQIAKCSYAKDDSNNFSIYLQLYNLFIFFWTLFFVGAVGQMILASAFATYYWTFNKTNIPFFVVATSAWRVIRYHLGTAAFGSLLLALVSWLRALLEIADAKLKKYDNSFVRAVKCCMRCFFWCLENFLRFLNKNAYIMCAIHGKNFCSSAREAFSLLIRNVIRVFVVDKVTDFLFFISKMVITTAVGAASFYIFSNQSLLQSFLKQNSVPGELPTVTYSFVPIVFTVVGTYIIATVFFNVYSMAVDTMFLCFLEDCEINDGSQEKPYFMSKNLMRILGRKNKKQSSD